VEIDVFPLFQEEGGRTQSVRWTLRGSVKPLFQNLARTIELGEMCEGTATTTVFTVTPCQRLSALAANIGTRGAKTVVCEIDEVPQRFEVRLSLMPDHVGALVEQLELQPFDAKGELLRPVAVDISGTVVQEVRTTPSQVKFGVVEIGDSANAAVLVEPYRAASFGIADIRIRQPEKLSSQESELMNSVTAELHTDAAGSKSVNVQFEAHQAGYWNTEVVIYASTEESREVVIRVPISAYVPQR